jgi:peroxiredoxin
VLTSSQLFIAVIIAGVLAAAWFGRDRFRRREMPEQLRPGQALPEFAAVDESGRAVRSSDLHGAAAVILFVRGNWCPFCTRQVADLADRYKEILDLGAKLILITPKPLQTTRRVADIFGVDFDFWLDGDLAVTRSLGLDLRSGVPGKHRDDYGADTLWPTSLVVDKKGIIRYTALSRFIADRPNPATLVAQLKKL